MYCKRHSFIFQLCTNLFTHLAKKNEQNVFLGKKTHSFLNTINVLFCSDHVTHHNVWTYSGYCFLDLYQKISSLSILQRSLIDHNRQEYVTRVLEYDIGSYVVMLASFANNV